MRRSKITGMGSYVPPRVVANIDLEKLMDTSDEWITQRTGIKTRHWASDDVGNSDLGLEASNIAIENAGIKKEDIDMIIYATISGDYDFPGTGCFLQAKMELPDIPIFDIKQQCTGFIYALSMADMYVRQGDFKNILIVGAELQSKALDKSTKGRDISVLFGDGAGAVVVSATDINDEKNDPYIYSTHLHTNGQFADKLCCPAPGTALGPERMSQTLIDKGLHFPVMHGKVVFVHAVKKMTETICECLSANNLKMEDIDMFFFHQANMRINDAVGEKLEIPAEKIFNTVQKYGNTTAATIPLGMHDAMKEGKLKEGMLVATAAFGGGFTWGSAIFRL